MNASPPDLDALLSSLHLAGLPVGTRERVRLQHVFRLAPRLDGRAPDDGATYDGVREVLRAALVHDLDEGKIFDQVYGLWSERWQRWLTAGLAARQKVDPADVDVPLVEGSADLGERLEGRRPKKSRRSWRRWAMLRVAVLVLPLLWLQGAAVTILDAPPPGPELTITPPPSAPSTAGVETLESNFAPPLETVYYPHFEVVGELEGFGVDLSRLWLGLLLLTLAGVLGTLAERKALPVEPRPPPSLGGPPRLPLLPLPSRGPELLDPASLRTLVWGVEKHVTEYESRHLDVPASAAASAEQGGLPTLCFEPEEALREVWLWIDTWASDDALVEVWAGEISESLRRAGLPVRLGRFDGVPDTLSWDDGGQVFQPRHVESQRQFALVAILTDGAALAAHLVDGRRRGVLELFRGLRSWPRLAVVDCSPSAGRSQLGDLPVPCLRPTDLPAFFGLGRTAASAPPKADLGTLRAWKAALALGIRPPERGTAWRLARALELDVAPSEVHRLDDVASNDSTEDLVRWLALDAYRGTPHGMRAERLLDGALDFWRDRLRAEAKRREDRRELDGWNDSRAERHLAVERAVLDLWRQPEKASRTLQSLAGGEWGEVIRLRLGGLAPRDGAGEALVPLPWRLREVDDVVKQRLAALGLGGVGQGTLQRSGRLMLGFVLLMTLALVSLGRGFWVPQEDRQPEIYNLSPMDGSRVVSQPTNDATWRVEATAPDGTRFDLEDAGGKRVKVDWFEIFTQRDVPNLETRVGIPFVGLQGGTFAMGSESGASDESPVHRVTVGDFWMAQTETTNRQYRGLVPDHPLDDDQPVVGVTWFEARDYCRALGNSDASWQFDLPTESEWEYAARAGTSTDWSFGNDERLLGFHAWYEGNSELKAQEVATRAPSPWGFHDLHGNVWEWVRDCYDDYPSGELPQDPALVSGSCHQDDTRSADRVLRGGSFDLGPRFLRSAFRSGYWTSDGNGRIGFRCVRRPVPQLDPLTP